MPTDLKLPLLGDVMHEGTVAEWLKPDGALVERGEPVYRLETDKVTFEVESPEAGYLEHLVDEGSVVAVGAMVGRIIEVAEEVSASPQPVWWRCSRRMCRRRQRRGGWRASAVLIWPRWAVGAWCANATYPTRLHQWSCPRAAV